MGRCVGYWCHEGACAPHGCVRGGRDRGRETQPGKGQRSVCVSGGVCVCVCVWRAVCVCVGGYAPRFISWLGNKDPTTYTAGPKRKKGKKKAESEKK